MWSLPTSPLAHSDAIISGDNFRITVLTDGLLRLEWSDDGTFEDRASAFALHRDLEVPSFRVVDRPENLQIITDRVHLIYDRQPFSTNGLSIQVRGNVSNYRSVWRYGNQPITLGGTARTLDDVNGSTPLEPGVVSRSGFAVHDDSRTLVLEDDGWVSPRDGSRTDLYFFGFGHDYAAAVQALFALSGRPPVLPRFALGNWWSRYHRYSAAEYADLMNRFAEAGIPLSVAVLDMDWHLVDVDPVHGSGWTGYTWNRELFPDPAGFLDDLHRRDLRVTLNVHPADGIRPFEDAFGAMREALGQDSDDPIPFDITDRTFLTAYFDVLHRKLEDEGVDFWWIDWQSGPHSRIAGIDPLWMLNHFHFLDNARQHNHRPLTFSRYAGPGSHRYPVGFSGDTHVTWESLHFQPEFTATASNIGYGWWSHDIGGHMFGYKDDELTRRWVQLGVFSPILRLHSTSNPFATKEPWTFDAATEQVMTDQLRLRHRLVPYLHTMNHRAAAGTPLVRPMYWAHPNAPEAYDVPNEFLFGDLLIAPITTPRDRQSRLSAVTGWLPEGEWADLHTGVRYIGNRLVDLHRDDQSIPVLGRAGTILPLDGAERPGNGAGNPASIEVAVFAADAADGFFELIEDDETDDLLTTPIRWDRTAGTLTIGPAAGNVACVTERRDWSVELVGSTVDNASATVDGAAVELRGLKVSDVPTTSRLVIELAVRRADNQAAQRAFALLDDAQIMYEEKRRAYAVITNGQPAAQRAGHLAAMGLPAAVTRALTELLLADPNADANTDPNTDPAVRPTGDPASPSNSETE